VSASGEATLAARRSSTSRVRGPGTGVLSSIVRVVAIVSSVPEFAASLHSCIGTSHSESGPAVAVPNTTMAKAAPLEPTDIARAEDFTKHAQVEGAAVARGVDGTISVSHIASFVPNP
jgi:hypothetical protein